MALFENWNRFYDPATGRYTAPDPLLPSADGTGLRRYAYAANGPIMTTDPDGKQETGADRRMPGGSPTVNAEKCKQGDKAACVRQKGDLITGAIGAVVMIVAAGAGAVAALTPTAKVAAGGTLAQTAATQGDRVARSAEGLATVFEYGGEHASVMVQSAGHALHTEQVIVGNTTTIAQAMGQGATSSLEIPLPNAAGAMQFQQAVLGTNTGAYSRFTNSCVTHCGDVLRAGGVSAPTGTRALVQWLQSVNPKP